MMKEEEKSTRDQMDPVIDCMSLEELEWSISIAEKEEEVQECGDVIFLIVMMYSRASTSTLALLQQVFGCVCGGPYLVFCFFYLTHNRSAVFAMFFVLFC